MVARKYLLFLTVISAVMIALGFGIIYKSQSEGLHMKGHSFTVERARTKEQRAKGLSGRSSLANDHAMIFVANSVSEQCFWMKDMQFAIDIIWLTTDKKIVAVEQNVLPTSYPQNYCHDGQYVVEVTSGTTQRLGLKPGDTVRF